MVSAGVESRIPTSLQAVFLASNRGNDVHVAPPKQVAFRVFARNIIPWKAKSNDASSADNVYPQKPNSLQKPSSSSTRKKNSSPLWSFTGAKKSKSSNKAKTVASEKNSKKKSMSAPATKVVDKSSKGKAQKSVACATGKSDVSDLNPKKEMSPQDYLDDLMKLRGYSTKRYNTLKTAYHNKPTPLQRSSYDLHLIGLVKQNRTDTLTDIFQSGISPNPCNIYGESLLHMVCRRGEYHILKVMLDNNCNVQVADDYGRTPLHDACWASEPATETVQLLLDKDLSLILMTDCRGFLPLSYVRKEHWQEWINFINFHKDTYWPEIEVFERDANGKKERVKITSDLVNQSPDSRPLQDPANALPLDLASMVASGTIRPEEAAYLRKRREKGLDDDDTTEEDDEDDESKFSEDDDDDDIDNSNADEEEEEDDDDTDSSDSSDDSALLADLPISGFRKQ